MAVSLAYNNSATAYTPSLIGTEYTLFTSAVAGTYTYHVDCTNMAAGDVLVLRIYQTISVSGSSGLHVVYRTTYADAQPADDMIKVSVPISDEQTSGSPLTFTLQQTAGTARAYWVKILLYA